MSIRILAEIQCNGCGYMIHLIGNTEVQIDQKLHGNVDIPSGWALLSNDKHSCPYCEANKQIIRQVGFTHH